MIAVWKCFQKDYIDIEYVGKLSRYFATNKFGNHRLMTTVSKIVALIHRP